MPAIFAPLRTVLFGGEAVDARQVRAVLRAGGPARLLNMYGPTETTTFALWHEVVSVPAAEGTVPIGRPIAHTQVYVLDRRQRLVPPRRGNGWICPFLRCITEGCDGQMVWLDSDRQKSIERLNCDHCGNMVDENIIVLTRKRMRHQPPDILFTSTEMLNQRMTNSRIWHLFGIGQRAPLDKKPAFVLLDEAISMSGRRSPKWP